MQVYPFFFPIVSRQIERTAMLKKCRVRVGAFVAKRDLKGVTCHGVELVQVEFRNMDGFL